MKCWLSSGKFESSIHIPLNYTKEEMDNFVEAWLGLMRQGIKLGAKL